MKKIIAILTIIMVFILPFSVTFNEQKAHANIISKPLTITAKKVAKELAQESAVAMAEHILFEKAINEFINSDIEDGYKAVCLDGPVNKVEDCSPSKVVQVKENLSSTDKTTLKNKVEQVLEKKTNTSSKWTKFLDWFVPIFLISGLVATFESMIDGDSESLIDEIAMEALVDAGLIKGVTSSQPEQTIDWTTHISAVKVSLTQNSSPFNFQTALDLTLKQGASIKFTYLAVAPDGYRDFTVNAVNPRVLITGLGSFSYDDKSKEYFGYGIIDGIGLNSQKIPLAYRTNAYKTSYTIADSNEAMNIGFNWLSSSLYSQLKSKESNVNAVMNQYMATVNSSRELLKVSIPPIVKPPVQPEFTPQRALEKIKNPDGTVTTPGIENFKYTYNNTYIYPSPDSTTGWKDKATDLDITVVEDDVVVDDGAPPTDPEAPPAEDDDINTDKDKDKIKKKSRDWSALLTTRFPFSLPWDFLHLMKFLYAEPMTPHWEIKGTEKIPFNLKIDLKFMEPYAPWFRTFIFLSFVMSVIFLHGRFMGGSK